MYEATLMSFSKDDTTVRDNGFIRGALPRRYADGASRTFLPEMFGPIFVPLP